MEVGEAVQPGNRFVSSVRASGRGEAKLRGRARDDEGCVARAPAGQKYTSDRPPLRAGVVAAVVALVVAPVVPPPLRVGVVAPVVALVVPPLVSPSFRAGVVK